MKSFRKLVKPGLLALTCGIMLAGLNLQTADVIAENQRYYEQKLLRVMVEDVTTEPELIETGSGFRVLSDGLHIATIRTAETGKGYNGDIRLLVAFTPDGEILSVRVVGHGETPGIGDKIDIEVSPWIHQFNGTNRSNTNWALAPAGDIDGITGATITSRAVTDAVLGALPE